MFIFTEILGGDGTPYNGGVFTLTIELPERFVFNVSFSLHFQLPLILLWCKYVIYLYSCSAYVCH